MTRKSFQYQVMILALALLVASMSFAKTHPATAAETTDPTLTLSPTTALPNQYVAITGENFTTGGSATLSSLTIGSVAVDPSKINFGGEVEVDNNGGFVTNLVVPMNSATLAAGALSVTATDSGGVSASATLTISTPAISVSPTEGRAGSTATITGSNYPVASSNLGTDQVPLVSINYYLTTNNNRQVATVYPDSTGAFTVEFQVPLNATIPSTDNTIEAVMSNATLKPTAEHSVTEPSVSISPTTGDPGTAVTITGTDFNSFIRVNSMTIGSVQIEDATEKSTDINGGLTVNTTIPKIDIGAQPVSVQINGKTYTVIFTVTGTTAPVSNTQPADTQPVSSQLSSLGKNLVRVFHFDNATKEWTFYDPDEDVVPFSTLTELTTGKAYWVKVLKPQVITVGGAYRDLFEGWNLVAW